MKIILEALGKLKSEVMDVPEETGSKFRMALTQPITVVITKGLESAKFPQINTICEFEWTGTYVYYNDQCLTDKARLYLLRNITK